MLSRAERKARAEKKLICYENTFLAEMLGTIGDNIKSKTPRRMSTNEVLTSQRVKETFLKLIKEKPQEKQLIETSLRNAAKLMLEAIQEVKEERELSE